MSALLSSPPAEPAPPTRVRDLLGELVIPGHGSLPCPEEATFEELSEQSSIREASSLSPPGSAAFLRHDTFTLPDNPPVKGGPRSTTVHKFQLAGGEPLAARLLDKAQAWMQDAAHASCRVSNRGGSYHSSEETIILEQPPAWCDEALVTAVQEALATVAPDTQPECQRLTGWFNLATSRKGYNALHDHGTASWSCVFFVACNDGESQQERPADPGQLSRFPGHLLLRTQLEPFTQKFAFLPIAPQPGWLYLFPGHVCHAVAPFLPSEGGVNDEEEPAGSREFCRMTCAFNVATTTPPFVADENPPP